MKIACHENYVRGTHSADLFFFCHSWYYEDYNREQVDNRRGITLPSVYLAGTGAAVFHHHLSLPPYFKCSQTNKVSPVVNIQMIIHNLRFVDKLQFKYSGVYCR